MSATDSLLITSRETLEYTRYELRAHTTEPTYSFGATFGSHTRVCVMPDNGFVFFGNSESNKQRSVGINGRVLWDAETRLLQAWYWLPGDKKFRGLHLETDGLLISQNHKSYIAFNGFSAISTDRDTTLQFGNVIATNCAGLEVVPVELGLNEQTADRLVEKHFDIILRRKIQEIMPLPGPPTIDLEEAGILHLDV